MVLIKSPSTEQEFASYYQFRWEQLRKPLGLSFGSERDQMEEFAYHCMAVDDNGSLVGVGRIHITPQQDMQIRYMAVDARYQNQGIGTSILNFLLSFAVDQRVPRCWLNARSAACHFYEKAGFENLRPVSSELDIPHFRMEIALGRS